MSVFCVIYVDKASFDNNNKYIELYMKLHGRLEKAR